MKHLLIIFLVASGISASAQCKTKLTSPYKVVYNSITKKYAIRAGVCTNPIQTNYVNQQAGYFMYLGWGHKKTLEYPGGEDSAIVISNLNEGLYTNDGFYFFQELTFKDSCTAKASLTSYLGKKKLSVIKSKKADAYPCKKCSPYNSDSYLKKHSYK